MRGIINVDDNRDNLLTKFGKLTLKQRYCLSEELPQDVFARASYTFAGGDLDLAQRLYDYSSKLWLSYATPLIANGGTARGLPISCFLNYVGDSIHGLADNLVENAFLSTSGGGIGSYWGDVRAIGEKTSKGIETPGVIPFIHVVDSQMLAYHQGSTRRGAAAVYMDVSHPEIMEFIRMRTPNGDAHRKNENLHHGVGITDKFMEAVEKDSDWLLIDHTSGHIHDTIKARELWILLLQTRLQTGEPYLFFKDTTNDALPKSLKAKGLKVHHSNLCTEITLPTSADRTAVCCLSSINLAKYREWEPFKEQFIADIVTMLDNTLEVFIKQAPPEMWRAVSSASKERSIGIGTLGFHTLLQQEGIPIESMEAEKINISIFADIKKYAIKASQALAIERGEPEDMWGTGMRHSHLMAIAPNASSSIICGGVSPSIEPLAANAFAHKTQSGTHEVRNPALAPVLEKYGLNTDDVWNDIIVNKGSVQHLPLLTDDEKEVFKTAIEIDQMALIKLAAGRQHFICQAQSLNLFFRSDVHVRALHQTHFTAWKKGLKSLYYLRSEAVKQAEVISKEVERKIRQECTDEVCTMCEG